MKIKKYRKAVKRLCNKPKSYKYIPIIKRGENDVN